MNNEKQRRILERIKLLFKLGESPNENEAASAIAKARALMDKYNLSDADLESQTINDFIEVGMLVATKNNEPALLLAVWLGKAFFIVPLMKERIKPGTKKTFEKEIRFIGTKADVAVSTYIYSYMMNLIEIKSDEYFQTVRDTQDAWTPAEVKKVKYAYAVGFAHAVVEKLKAIDAENAAAAAKKAAEVAEHALIETKAVAVIKNDLIKKYMEEAHPEAEESKSEKIKFDANHYSAGYVEGEKHGIFRGVKSTAAKTKEIRG